MHTVELLDEALAAARAIGLTVRQDWLGGTAGGACEIKGRPWVFIDLSLSPREQLDQVAAALREMADLSQASPSVQLREFLTRRAA